MDTNEKIRASQSLEVNGRSFHWASLFLTRSTRDKSAQLYAFCRVLDDLADGDIPDGAARLSKLKLALAHDTQYPDAQPSEWQAFLDETAFSKPVLAALVDGLVRDAEGPVCLGRERIYSDMPTVSRGLLVS